MSEDLRAKVRALMALGDSAMTADLIIDVVARGLGKMGGRPKKPVMNGLETGSEPAIEPVTEPVSPENDSVSPAPPSDPISSQSLRSGSDPERAIPGTTEPPLLVFPCDGKPREFAVTAMLLAQHKVAFPALDVMAEYRKALVWVAAAPDRRKTARGMAKFLVGWLGRAQDSGKGAKAPLVSYRPVGAPVTDDYCQLHRDVFKRDWRAHRPQQTCPVCRELKAKDRPKVETTPQAVGALFEELPGWVK